MPEQDNLPESGREFALPAWVRIPPSDITSQDVIHAVERLWGSHDFNILMVSLWWTVMMAHGPDDPARALNEHWQVRHMGKQDLFREIVDTRMMAARMRDVQRSK